MKVRPGTWQRSAVFAILFCALATDCFSQSFPSRPIKIIVPSAAGGGLDVSVRRISEKISSRLGQPIVIDNRPGANGLIAAEAAASAVADGYTLFYASANILCANPALFSKLPYDPVKHFAPITLYGRGHPILLVNKKLPVKSLADFVQYAKSKAGKATVASPGVGTAQHLAAALLEQQAGVSFTHVPYKSQPQIMTDLIAGEIDGAMEMGSVAAPHVKAGSVRAIAVIGPKRKPLMPDVPTAAEQGMPQLSFEQWNGFLAPANTPREVIAALNKAIVASAREADIVQWAESLGSEIIAGTPEEFATYMSSEQVKWSRIIRQANVSLE